MKIRDRSHARARVKLGPTGTFSRGKVADDDQGDLMLGVIPDREHRIVRIEFGHEIAWLGLDPVTARAFIESVQRALAVIE